MDAFKQSFHFEIAEMKKERNDYQKKESIKWHRRFQRKQILMMKETSKLKILQVKSIAKNVAEKLSKLVA